MHQSKFLKTVFFALLLLWSTVEAQEPRSGEEPEKAAGEIPTMQEWWRGDEISNGEGISYLPNFKDGHDAIAISRKNGEIHTWLNRFPGDTQNVFTWSDKRFGDNDYSIHTGDFNGDGITDYIDGAGNIYRGIQNGMPPESEPVKTYGITGQIFDVNNDGYEDVYGSITLYGGPDLSNLQWNNQLQIPPGLNKIFNAFYKTPQGEYRVVMHLIKQDSIDEYILYRATWQKGSSTPQFEVLDSISRPLDFQHTSYFDGISGVYQSKHHNKTFLFNNETVYEGSLKKNAVIYDVTNDQFTESLRFRMDNANFNMLEHSIDGDKYEDWYMRRSYTEYWFYSGGEKFDSIPRMKSGNGWIASINDVSGDGINDVFTAYNNVVILKGIDLTTEISIEESDKSPFFSIGEIQPHPLPTNSISLISISIRQHSQYTLSLYTLEGHKISDIFTGWLEPGTYPVPVKIASGISAGMCLLRLSNGSQSVERTIIITN